VGSLPSLPTLAVDHRTQVRRSVVITKPTGTMNFRTFSEILFNFRLTPPLVAGGIAFSLAMGLVGGFFPAGSGGEAEDHDRAAGDII
jgi:hypothetical protein